MNRQALVELCGPVALSRLRCYYYDVLRNRFNVEVYHLVRERVDMPVDRATLALLEPLIFTVKASYVPE